MATIASQRKLNTKSIKDRYRALKEMEDGKTKLQVAAKHSISKNTLSTWLKNIANLDQAMFKWLLVVRKRDEAVSALVFKTKAFEFAEEMNVENFKAFDGWLNRWKKRFNVSFKACVRCFLSNFYFLTT